MAITLDVKVLDAKFADAVGIHAEKQEAKAANKSDQKIAAFGALGVNIPHITLPPDITLCGSWPQIRDTINTYVSYLGWLSPKTAALVKGFVVLVDTQIMPKICAPAM